MQTLKSRLSGFVEPVECQRRNSRQSKFTACFGPIIKMPVLLWGDIFSTELQ